MGERSVIGAAGVPREEQVFAVFDDEAGASAAEDAARRQGVAVQRLRPGVDGHALAGEDPPRGILGRLERLAKRIESHEAERYAGYLAQGKAVLVLEAADRETARRSADLLVAHGGYDVTYYQAWGTEYMSSEANQAHGVSSHTSTNVETPRPDG